MNQAHIHLLLNHLPVFGSLIGGFVILQGIWTRNKQTKIAAYLIFIAAAIGSAIVYFTGEGAEEAIENIPGIAGDLIHEHEEFALFAFISFIVLGLGSIIALFFTMKNKPIARVMAFITLGITIVSFCLVARTAYLGGQIRHTEIDNTSNTTTANPNAEEED